MHEAALPTLDLDLTDSPEETVMDVAAVGAAATGNGGRSCAVSQPAFAPDTEATLSRPADGQKELSSPDDDTAVAQGPDGAHRQPSQMLVMWDALGHQRRSDSNPSPVPDPATTMRLEPTEPCLKEDAVVAQCGDGEMQIMWDALGHQRR